MVVGGLVEKSFLGHRATLKRGGHVFAGVWAVVAGPGREVVTLGQRMRRVCPCGVEFSGCGLLGVQGIPLEGHRGGFGPEGFLFRNTTNRALEGTGKELRKIFDCSCD